MICMSLPMMTPICAGCCFSPDFDRVVSIPEPLFDYSRYLLAESALLPLDKSRVLCGPFGARLRFWLDMPVALKAILSVRFMPGACT